jgi:hypothetical protein
MFLPNMVFINVEEILSDRIRLRFSVNDRQTPEKEIFSSELFTLQSNDGWSVNNIIANFDPTRTLEEHQ